jgi:predicted ATPase
MLARILNRTRRKVAGTILLASLVGALASCATKDPGQLINDPNARRETALPWNEQQKWEREGEASAINQQRR